MHVKGRKAVADEPFDFAGDALGHAGETSGLSRRGRAAYGSTAAVIVL
jgi:hypothetical protein